jgi:hypothetical protein
MAALVGERVDAAAAHLATPPPTTAPPPPSSTAVTAPPAAVHNLLGALTPSVLGTVVYARRTPIAPAAVVNGSSTPASPRASQTSDAPSTVVLASCAALAVLGIGVWIARRSKFAGNP